MDRVKARIQGKEKLQYIVKEIQWRIAWIEIVPWPVFNVFALVKILTQNQGSV